MRKIIITLAGVLSFLLIILLALPFVVDINQYKKDILDKVKEQTGYQVELRQPVSLSFLPLPTVFLQDIKVDAVSEFGDQETLFEAQALEVQISLTDLLMGKIAIQSLTLESPAISIHQHESGRFNFQSEKLFPDNKSETAKAEFSSNTSLSIGAFHIRNGDVAFLKSQNGQAKVKTFHVTDINSAFRMDSLDGPFEVNGEFVLNGQSYAVKGNTGQMGNSHDPLALNVSVNMPAHDVSLDYAGVLSFENDISAQGEITLGLSGIKQRVANLSKIDNAKLTALVSFENNVATMTNASLQLGDQIVSGRGSANINDMSFNLAMGAIGIIDLDKIINPINSGQMIGTTSSTATPSDVKQHAAFIPDLLFIPKDMEVDFSINLPGFRYGGELFGEIKTSALSNAGSHDINLALLIATLPGQGDLNIQGTYTQSSEKKPPSLNLDVVARTKNLPFSLDTLGLQSLGLASLWSEAFLGFSAEVLKDKLTIKDAKLSLDGTEIHGKFSFDNPQEGRALLTLQTTSDVLMLDDTLERIAQSQGKKENAKASIEQAQMGVQDALKKAIEPFSSLPIDVKADIGIQRLRFMNQDIRGVRAVFTLDDNASKDINVSIQNLLGAALTLQGDIGNLKELSDVDLSLRANADDVRKFMGNINLDTLLIPEKISSANFNSNVKGNLNKLDVTANAKAAGTEILVSGLVEQPLEQMKASQISLQLKNANTASLLGLFVPDLGNNKSLSKKLDMYADLSVIDQKYELHNMKGYFAGAALDGGLSIDISKKKPHIVAGLKVGEFTYQDTLFQRRQGSRSGQRVTSTPWSREAIDKSWLHSLDLDLDLSAQSLVYNNWSLKTPMIKASLKGGTLNMNEFSSDLFGGNVAGAINLSSTAVPRDPLSFDGDFQLRDVDFAELIKSLSGSELIKGKGRLSTDVKLKASGISQVAMIFDLTGEGNITGSNIMIEGMDLTRFAKALSADQKISDSVQGLWRGTTGGGSTNFEALDGAFVIKEGVADISKLDLDGSKAYIATTGSVDLTKWRLDTKHTITMKPPEQVEPFDIEFSGPLNNPSQTFAQGALENYFERKIERKLNKVLTDKLGLPSNDSGQPNPAEDAVRGLLQGILGAQ